MDALPQDAELPLEISTTFFKNLSPNVGDLFISEEVRFFQGHHLKKITRENRGSFW